MMMKYQFLKRIVGIRFIGSYILSKVINNEGGAMKSATLRKLYKDLYKIEAGKFSYGWNNHKNIVGPVKIGNYVSIGPNVRIYPFNHTTNGITTHPIIFNPICGYVEKDQRERRMLNIGHDVWIGANCVILPSCKKIGTGSVIGAGSIVTKDVPPYAIVAGNPARIIRYRFDEDTISRMLDSKWWELPEKVIKENIRIMQDPQKFLNTIEKK